jgi:hypothetical protein
VVARPEPAGRGQARVRQDGRQNVGVGREARAPPSGERRLHPPNSGEAVLIPTQGHQPPDKDVRVHLPGRETLLEGQAAEGFDPCLHCRVVRAEEQQRGCADAEGKRLPVGLPASDRPRHRFRGTGEGRLGMAQEPLVDRGKSQARGREIVARRESAMRSNSRE